MTLGRPPPTCTLSTRGESEWHYPAESSSGFQLFKARPSMQLTAALWASDLAQLHVPVLEIGFPGSSD